jgi:hypothetical protein
MGEVSGVCSDAASQGYLGVLIWAKNFGFTCDKYVYAAAARSGHLHVIQWLHRNKCPNGKTGKKMVVAAAEAGHLHILKWAHKNDYAFHLQEANTAAISGQLGVLKWLRRKGFRPSQNIVHKVVRYGQLKVLKWLFSKGYQVGGDDFDISIAHGHIHILKWIQVITGQVDGVRNFQQIRAAQNAALCGNIDMLKWLISNGFPWGWLTCGEIKKQLDALPEEMSERMQETLDWARANGCPE